MCEKINRIKHSKELLKRAVLRPLTPDDYGKWAKVAESAWGLPEINRPWDFTALTKDSIASPALYDGDEMIGTSLNMIKVGESRSPYLLVHMLGVNEIYQGYGVGKRLMQANYELVQEGHLPGVEEVKLTSDPLDGRNAHLYLHSSRMHSNTYIPEAYKGLGENGGERHRGLPSDRLYYEARPTSAWVTNGTPPSAEQVQALIKQSQELSGEIEDLPVRLVETPSDYMGLKNGLVDEALLVQEQLARRLQTAFAQGYTVVDHIIDGRSPEKRQYILCVKGFDETNPQTVIDAINSL